VSEKFDEPKDQISILNQKTKALESEISRLQVYEIFFNISKDLVCLANTEGYFLMVNPSFIELLGYSEEELLSKPIVDFILPDDKNKTSEEIDKIDKTGETTAHFINHYITKSGETVILQWMSTTDKNGIIYAIGRDITEQKILEEKLIQNTELLNAAQRMAKLGNFSFNTINYSLYWSDELYNIFAITDEEKNTLYEAYIKRFDEEGFEVFSSTVEKAMIDGQPYAFQHKVHTPNGNVKSVSCFGLPYVNEEGKVYRIDGVVQDITDIVKKEEFILKSIKEKEFLIKELHHRVKNNLQVISSLLSLQANLVNDENLDIHFKESQNRIKSMAAIHDMLYRSEDLSTVNFSIYAEQLVKDLIHSYVGMNSSITTEFEFDSLELSLDIAVPLGLLINELVTNSLKYAYEGHSSPLLKVSIKTRNDHFSLCIADNGKGFDLNRIENDQSLGMMVISNLSEQLDGKSEFTSSDKGTSFCITTSRS
jgi:PAS domain S-box-containing protein